MEEKLRAKLRSALKAFAKNTAARKNVDATYEFFRKDSVGVMLEELIPSGELQLPYSKTLPPAYLKPVMAMMKSIAQFDVNDWYYGQHVNDEDGDQKPQCLYVVINVHDNDTEVRNFVLSGKAQLGPEFIATNVLPFHDAALPPMSVSFIQSKNDERRFGLYFQILDDADVATITKTINSWKEGEPMGMSMSSFFGGLSTAPANSNRSSRRKSKAPELCDCGDPKCSDATRPLPALQPSGAPNPQYPFWYERHELAIKSRREMLAHQAAGGAGPAAGGGSSSSSAGDGRAPKRGRDNAPAPSDTPVAKRTRSNDRK